MLYNRKGLSILICDGAGISVINCKSRLCTYQIYIETKEVVVIPGTLSQINSTNEKGFVARGHTSLSPGWVPRAVDPTSFVIGLVRLCLFCTEFGFRLGGF